jgi:hypothetical protein
MCNSSPKVQAPPPAAPPPAPVPSPRPADVTPQLTTEQRQGKIAALKFGAMSTIKTGPQGVAGAGPELNTPAAGGTQKKAIGA